MPRRRIWVSAGSGKRTLNFRAPMALVAVRKSSEPLMNLTSGGFPAGFIIDVEFRRCVSFRESAELVGAHVLLRGFGSRPPRGTSVVRLHRIQPCFGFGRRVTRGEHRRIDDHRIMFSIEFFIRLSEMITDGGSLISKPGGVKIFLGHLEVTQTKVYPSESIPVCGQYVGCVDVVGKQIIQRDVRGL